MPWGIDNGGLDLDRPDELDPEEWASFARAQYGPFGFPEGLPMWQLWSEFRPDLIKTHRMNMRHAGPHVLGATQLPFIPADLHLYLLTQFTDGVEYELRACQHFAWSRPEVMDVIAIAALDTVSRGLNDACTPVVMQMIRDWPDSSDTPEHFPAHWRELGPEALTSGIDLTEPGMTDDEVAALRDWYLRVAGEVPPWFAFLNDMSRTYMKTQRIRWEKAMKVSPPALLPFLKMHFNVARCVPDGIREHVLLGRGLGMSKSDVVSTLLHGAMVGAGLASLSVVEGAVGDVLRAWES